MSLVVGSTVMSQSPGVHVNNKLDFWPYLTNWAFKLRGKFDSDWSQPVKCGNCCLFSIHLIANGISFDTHRCHLEAWESCAGHPSVSFKIHQ